MREGQASSEAGADALEAVWQHLLRAVPRSTVWRKEFVKDSEKHAKELFFRPFRRFADSLRARLAPMVRWEAWLKTEGCDTEDNVYAPEDVLLGKFLLSVSQGGPTSAAAVWEHLQWWVRHLGLSLPLSSPLVVDFKFAAIGHRVRAAVPLDFAVLPETIKWTTEDLGAKSTMAGFCALVHQCLREIQACAKDQVPEAW